MTKNTKALYVKSAEEIEKMRTAGRLAAEVLEMITPYVKPGITTLELNDLCEKHIVEKQGAIPAPPTVGFPKAVCASPNHVVCHGIPNEKKLKDGDILNIDVSLVKDGFHGDTSKMFIIGKPSILAERLVRVTQECLYLAIKMVKPGMHLGDLGAAIAAHAEKHHYSVVREFCGHGIGRGFHEEPQVLHYGTPGTREELVPGMIFTIEPMINAGKRHIKMLPDGWTAVTKDHQLSAQWEHTILVTNTGYEVLSIRQEEDFPAKN